MPEFELDPEGQKEAAQQVAREDFTLQTLSNGKAALAKLYPIAAARARGQKSATGTVAVMTMDLIDLCHGYGVMANLLARVTDDALSSAVLDKDGATRSPFEEPTSSGASSSPAEPPTKKYGGVIHYPEFPTLKPSSQDDLPGKRGD